MRPRLSEDEQVLPLVHLFIRKKNRFLVIVKYNFLLLLKEKKSLPTLQGKCEFQQTTSECF